MSTRRRNLSYLAIASLVFLPATLVGASAMNVTSAQVVEADGWDGLELALSDGAVTVELVLAGAKEEGAFPELELAIPDDDDITILAAKLERNN